MKPEQPFVLTEEHFLRIAASVSKEDLRAQKRRAIEGWRGYIERNHPPEPPIKDRK